MDFAMYSYYRQLSINLTAGNVLIGEGIMTGRINKDINVRKVNDKVAVVNFSGEMDLYSTPAAKEKLTELMDAGTFNIVVNMKHTMYIDSTALGMLVGAFKRARENNGELRLVSPSDRVQKLLELTRLVNVFSIDDTEDAAISKFNGEA
jgi:anti-sigma B factor antagonist